MTGRAGSGRRQEGVLQPEESGDSGGAGQEANPQRVRCRWALCPRMSLAVWVERLGDGRTNGGSACVGRSEERSDEVRRLFRCDRPHSGRPQLISVSRWSFRRRLPEWSQKTQASSLHRGWPDENSVSIR